MITSSVMDQIGFWTESVQLTSGFKVAGSSAIDSRAWPAVLTCPLISMGSKWSEGSCFGDFKNSSKHLFWKAKTCPFANKKELEGRSNGSASNHWISKINQLLPLMTWVQWGKFGSVRIKWNHTWFGPFKFRSIIEISSWHGIFARRNVSIQQVTSLRLDGIWTAFKLKSVAKSRK